MSEYHGEERRIESRLTKLETEIGQIKDLATEVREFRHDLFLLLNPVKDRVSEHNQELENIEKTKIPQRLHRLEIWRAYLSGAWAGLGICLYLLWAYVKETLSSFKHG